MGSTDGPLASAKIRCPRGHWFNGPIEFLTWKKHRIPGQRKVRPGQTCTGSPARKQGSENHENAKDMCQVQDGGCSSPHGAGRRRDAGRRQPRLGQGGVYQIELSANVSSPQGGGLWLQRRGLIRADLPAGQIHRDWTILIFGVVSQQLSNAPHESFEQGRFTAALPGLVSMFARYYQAPATSASRGREQHADTD
jgi:hypothetical protein